MSIQVGVIGIVGLPARYGGFETLVENLVRELGVGKQDLCFTVYCSGARKGRPVEYLGARLKYIACPANGALSPLYDALAIVDAVRNGADVLLVLGVSGAWLLPLVRRFTRTRIITNVDGIEWKRDKWGRLARWFLRWSEGTAVRNSSQVIVDNVGIREHIESAYGVDCPVVVYGGDHAITVGRKAYGGTELPGRFALSICRIEPENNVEMVLRAFRAAGGIPLVFVGNWLASEYGRRLKAEFASVARITLLDPIYDPGLLRDIRERASLYVHGHSAGGTNPSLVEMLFFPVAIAAFDCNFNRYTLEGLGSYFRDEEQLASHLRKFDPTRPVVVDRGIRELAWRKYTWAAVAGDYWKLLRDNGKEVAGI
jgi:glycosyltransferase involved in cell wall biosynthesis